MMVEGKEVESRAYSASLSGFEHYTLHSHSSRTLTLTLAISRMRRIPHSASTRRKVSSQPRTSPHLRERRLYACLLDVEIILPRAAVSPRRRWRPRQSTPSISHACLSYQGCQLLHTALSRVQICAGTARGETGALVDDQGWARTKGAVQRVRQMMGEQRCIK